MKHVAMSGLAIALATVLAGCGSGPQGGLERSFADAGSAAALEQGRAAQGGPSILPPGHPPISRGPLALPPGHPPIPEGLTCPGGGAGAEPAGERYGAEGLEVLSI
jgi:hypothetical protein